MGYYEMKEELGRYAPLEKDFALRAIKYSKLHSSGEIPDTPEDETKKLISDLEKVMDKMNVAQSDRERHIEFLKGIAKNPVSAIFIELMNGQSSEFFIQWLQDSMRAEAIALEPAYGWGRDLNGVYREIPKDDPAIKMADDTGYKFIQWRDEMAKNLLLKLRNKNIVCIAQGLMPEIRHHLEYPLAVFKSQRFFCYDPADINLEDYFDFDISENIFQKHLNLQDAILEEIKMMDKRTVNSFLIKGYMSYAAEEMPIIVSTICKLLPENGIFAFDLQVANWTMVRNKWIFLWAQAEGIDFKPVEDASSIEPMMKDIVSKMDLPIEIKVDIIPGDDPVGAFVTLTRVA